VFLVDFWQFVVAMSGKVRSSVVCAARWWITLTIFIVLGPTAVRRPRGSGRLGGYGSYGYGEPESERTPRVGVGANLK